MSRFRQFFSQPLVHFLILGALIFVTYGLVAPVSDPEPESSGEEIVVTQQQLDRLFGEFEAVWQRPANLEERQSVIDSYIREEILVREALRLGLDQGDTVMRRRLAQKMDFLSTSAARSLQPTEEDLATFYKSNEDDYRRPGLIAYEHVFLGPSADEELLEDLRANLRRGEDPEQLGKKTLLPFRMRLSERARVDGLFGEGFFEKLEALPLNGWQGPVRSGYGEHLVRVFDRQSPEVLSFERVRENVIEDWTQRRAQRIRAEALEAMRKRYRIVLPETER